MLRLRGKLILALVGLALVPIAITTLVVVKISTAALERASRNYRVATADYARHVVDGTLEAIERELDTIGAALAATAPTQERRRQARAALLGSRFIHRVAVYDAQGEHVFTLRARSETDVIPRLAAIDPAVAATARRQGLATLKTQKNKQGAYLLPVVVPVYRGKDKVLYAYLWAPVPLASLDVKLGELSRRRFGRRDDRVFIVDDTLHIIAHARPHLRGTSIARRGIVTDLPGGHIPRQAIAYAAAYRHGGEELLGILVPLTRPAWSIIVEERAADVYRTPRHTWRVALLVGGIFSFLAALLGVLMGGRLARPIRLLASVSRKIAHGDFDAQVDLVGHDEVADLGRAFNQMTRDLRRFRDELVEETRIRTDLGRYLDADVVETIVSGENALELGGQRREVTVLFADVVAFTPLAEKHDPEHVVAILNELFSFLTEIVFRHGGTVDKFIGDCVMAVFGAPYHHDDDPLRAVRTAEEMLRWLETGNAKWRKDLGREIALGIGIHTGEAVAGNIGSEKRMEYTVIGDTVNIAARLEALAQPGQVLMTRATATRVADEFDTVSRGKHHVIGRKEEVELFVLDD